MKGGKNLKSYNTKLSFFIWLLTSSICGGIGFLMYATIYEIREAVHWNTAVVVLIGIGVGTIISFIVNLIIVTVSKDKKLRTTINDKKTNVDEIIKYKKLFEDGTITAEEFEIVKKKLLK